MSFTLPLADRSFALARDRASGPRRRLLAWVLVALLLVAQALGVVHRSQHGLGVALPALTGASAEGGQDPGYGHLLGSADCRLFDHTALGDGLVAVAVAVVVQAARTAEPARTGTLPVARLGAAPYAARAPPLA